MTKLFISATLDRHRGFPPPACQIAIDCDGDGRADDGEFVNLSQAALKWTGVADTDVKPVHDIRVLVAFVGTLGAKYTVQIRRDDPENGKLLLNAKGIVTRMPDGQVMWLEDFG